MKNLLFILFLSIISINGFGQKSLFKLDSISNDFLLKLRNDSITDIVYYKSYCVGCIYEKKPCDYLGEPFNTYFIWKVKNKSYLKKIDNCGEYKKVAIKNRVIDFVESNKKIIKDEFVKDFSIKSIEGNDTNYLFIVVDHSAHSNIILYANEDIVFQHINYFDLSEKSGNDLNVNYTYNKGLKLVELDDFIVELIMRVEKKSKFIREKE